MLLLRLNFPALNFHVYKIIEQDLKKKSAVLNLFYTISGKRHLLHKFNNIAYKGSTKDIIRESERILKIGLPISMYINIGLIYLGSKFRNLWHNHLLL